MKTNRKKRGAITFAAVLAVIILTFSFASGCAPEYGGDAMTDVTVPATSAADTGTASTDAPYTMPEPTDTVNVHHKYDRSVFTVLRSSDTSVNDNIFADNAPDFAEMYTARDSAIKSEYGVTVSSFAVNDINTALQTGYLSGGNADIDAVVAPVADAGVRLLVAGLLQDLTEPGIGIGLSSPGVNASLTSDASFGGGIYLLFTDALYSDIGATSALYYRHNAAPQYTSALAALLGDDPAVLAMKGDFTLERMLVCLLASSETSGVLGNALADTGYVAFAVPESTAAFALTSTVCALDVHMFVAGSDGLPSVGITSDAYGTAYSFALSLISAAAPEGLPIFELTRLGAAGNNDGGLYLPLPRATGERADYCSSVDSSLICAFAVPAGVVDGGFTADMLVALGKYSADVRAAHIAKTIPGGELSEGLAAIILGTSHIDGAWLYGWGDVGEFIAGGLAARTDAATLFADRTLTSRIKAVDAAASIVASRCGS